MSIAVLSLLKKIQKMEFVENLFSIFLNSFRKSLVLNVCVQILPLREHFHNFLTSVIASKTKQSRRPLQRENFTSKMERGRSSAQTKEHAEIANILVAKSVKISH